VSLCRSLRRRSSNRATASCHYRGQGTKLRDSKTRMNDAAAVHSRRGISGQGMQHIALQRVLVDPPAFHNDPEILFGVSDERDVDQREIGQSALLDHPPACRDRDCAGRRGRAAPHCPPSPSSALPRSYANVQASPTARPDTPQFLVLKSVSVPNAVLTLYFRAS
jgi:hypothetical protein